MMQYAAKATISQRRIQIRLLKHNKLSLLRLANSAYKLLHLEPLVFWQMCQ